MRRWLRQRRHAFRGKRGPRQRDVALLALRIHEVILGGMRMAGETPLRHRTLHRHAWLASARVAGRAVERLFLIVFRMRKVEITRVRVGAVPRHAFLLDAVMTARANLGTGIKARAVACVDALVTARAQRKQSGVLLVREIISTRESQHYAHTYHA